MDKLFPRIQSTELLVKESKLDELEKYFICYDRTGRVGRERITKLKEEIRILKGQK